MSTHGDPAGYYAGCVCQPCRDGVRAYATPRRVELADQRATVNGRLTAPNAMHGTSAAFRLWSCRCAPCTAAHATTTRQHRATRRTQRAAQEATA